MKSMKWLRESIKYSTLNNQRSINNLRTQYEHRELDIGCL